MKTQEQMMIKGMVQGIYDVQKLRIASGQRILSQLLAKLNLPAEITITEDESSEEKASRKKMNDERDQIIFNFCEKLGIVPTDDKDNGKKKKKKITDFFEIIIRDYKGIIDYAAANSSSIKKAIANASVGIISDQSEMEILDAYFMLVSSEEKLLKPLERAVKSHPLWVNFLHDVKGCGPLMAGVILSEFDIHKAHYVSSFWKYAGLDTVELLDEDGNYTGIREGRSKKERHLIELSYTNKDGEDKTRKSITYNPFLKTKLVGVLGSCFLRSGSYYSSIYYGYRTRLDNNPSHDEKSNGHKHAMAIRYMIKYFLQDTFVAWCLVEGKTPPTPYHEGKLDMSPHNTTCPHLIPLLMERAPHLIVE